MLHPVNPFRIYFYPILLIVGLAIWLSADYFSDITSIIKNYWPSALIMVFGSFVAGSTPMGGGAVAFPVMNKLLLVEQQQAKLFSLFIQSIGMSFATALFFSLKVRIHWRILIKILPTTITGLAIGLLWYSPSESMVKFLFSCFAVTVGIMLLQIGKLDQRRSESAFEPPFLLLVPLGLICGLLAAAIGTGADTLLFFVMVFLCRYDVKQSIPTTVAYMAMSAICGTVIALLSSTEVSEFVVKSWYLAAPVVAIGAPLGGYVMRIIQRKYLFMLIEIIILAESLSTLIIGQLTLPAVLLLSLLSLTLCILLVLKAHQMFFTVKK